MERIRVTILALTAGAGIFASPIQGLGADTPRSESETYSAVEGEFPQSRFGYAPARGGNAAPGENERFETGPRSRSSSRSPASVHAAAVTAEEGYPDPSTRKSVRFANDVEAVTARRQGVQEVALIAGDLGFFPKTVFVTRDIPVRMFVTGASKGSLCLMMDSFQVRKQVRGGKIEEINFTPNQPGQYRFYCPVNGMEGTLVVKELAS